MRVVLVVNPSASSVTARNRVIIARELASGHSVEVVETSRRGHATRLAQGAAAGGADCVVVLGGDGTLSEAANGLAGTGTALAVLPGGSTNVFARTLGTPDDPVAAARGLLAALALGSIRRVGLGSVNGRYFLFHVGMGFDAAVVEQVERRGNLKRYAGHPLFVYAAFATWFRHYDRSRARLRVRSPGGDPVDDAYLAICLNTNPYTYLGSRPLDIAPDAGLDRGLVLVSVRTMAFAPLLGIVASSLGLGRPVRRRADVSYRSDLNSASVTGHGPFPYQIDGDFLGEVEELEFRHEPEVLDLVIPAHARGRRPRHR